MIIFSGFGILVVAFAVVAAAVTSQLNATYHFSAALIDVVFLVLFGAACIIFSWLVDAFMPGRMVIDKRTGAERHLKIGNRLFFIPMRVWGYFAVGLAVLFAAPDWDNVSAEITRIAAQIAAQSANAQPSETATPATAPTLVATSPSSSATAQAAFDYLKTNLSADSILNGYAGAFFTAVDGNICHIGAHEKLAMFEPTEFGVWMADVDLDSPEIKSDDDGQLRALNITAAKGKTFQVSTYNSDTKTWGANTPKNAAAFIIATGNNNAILRAFDTLAKECGAKENGF